MNRLLQDGALTLYGFVGDNFWDEGFTAQEVLGALAEHGRENDLLVRINSPGGYVDDGTAVFNALSMHKGKVTTQVDGVALSSASLIFQAGEERIVLPGAMVMIHDPANITVGTVADHEKTIEHLERNGAQMAGIYADRIGGDATEVRAAMKAETWMSADEAVASGYADKKAGGKAKAAAAFEYGVYAKAPEALKAMAAAKGWSISREAQRMRMSATAPKTETKPEDEIMTEAEKAAFAATAKAEGEAEGVKKGAKAAQERIRAIMTSPEAEGRQAQAELFAYDDKFASMDAATAIAALAAGAKAEAMAGEEPELTMEQKAEAYEQDRLKALALPGGKPLAKNGKPAGRMMEIATALHGGQNASVR